jgi:hypothetical protein
VNPFPILDFGVSIERVKRQISLFLTLLLSLFAVSVEAQQADKVPRVGYVSVRGASSQAPVLEGFREGLRELGYIEGKNIVIDLIVVAANDLGLNATEELPVEY